MKTYIIKQDGYEIARKPLCQSEVKRLTLAGITLIEVKE